jgi:hypothetical protein
MNDAVITPTSVRIKKEGGMKMNSRIMKGPNRLVVFMLLFFLLFNHAALAANTQPEPIQVFVNGSLLIMDTPPVVVAGRTLLPLRAIFEALGAEVEWDAVLRSISATKGNVSLLLYIGNTTAQKNGVPVILDVPPQIINGRTLVPLRFVGEALGADVLWDGVARKVTITSKTTLLLPGFDFKLLPDWVISALKLSIMDKNYDSAVIYRDKLAVKPLSEVLKPGMAYNPPWHIIPQPIKWATGCDYSPYITFTGNQDGAGGCIGRSIIHVMNVLKEMEHPYTPDLSFWYLHARQEQLAKGGPPDTKYVLEHNGICSEASMPSDYDNAPLKAGGGRDFSAMQQPSAATNSEASLYKVIESDPITPNSDNIKTLLRTVGPIIAGGPLILIQGANPAQGHCVTIVGYDDATQTVKCLNSWGDTWGTNGNGYFTVPYSKLAENFDYVRFYQNIPSDRTGTAHAYTARIHVQTGGTSRNKLTIKVGVTGKDPVTVWDTPNEKLWIDYSKTLNIDVPLPAYAKDFWPPSSEKRWYVQITNNSTSDTAELKEITFARLYKKSDGSFATETFKSSEAGRTIAPGKTEIIYVPKPLILPIKPILY